MSSRAGNSLIAHSLISLKSNERLWEIRSDRSKQMRKWAIVSESLRSLNTRATMRDSLRSLRGNEWMSDLLKKIWLKKSKIFFTKKKVFEKMSEALIFAYFLFFGERCAWIAHFTQIKWAMWADRSFHSSKMSEHERFAQVAQRKWVIVSELPRLLNKNEGMSESLIFWANRSFPHFLIKNKRFAWKSIERIPSPDVKTCLCK